MEQKPKINRKTASNIKRLLALALPEKWLLSVATLALFLSAGAQMAVPALFARLISYIGSVGEAGELNAIILYLFIAFSISSVFAFVRGSLFTLAGERLVARFRKRLFEAIIHQDISFFDTNQSGELQSRLASDSAVVQNAVTVNVSMGLRWTVQIIVGVVILFYISWKLTTLMLLIVPPLAISARYFGSAMRLISERYQDSLARASETAEEVFSCIRTVRSFAQEGKELNTYSKKINLAYEAGRTRAWYYGAFIGGVSFAASLGMLAVLWYGGTLVISQKSELNSATLTSFLLYTVYIAVSLGGLAGLYSTLMSAVGASERMFRLLDRVPQISSRPSVNGKTIDGGLRGQLEFDSVSFRYPSRSELLVLDSLSFRADPGKVTAIVGVSGSGKSTILSLIQRFYDPNEGVVKVDGERLIDLDYLWYHTQIAMVSQEPVLFANSIADNISYGLHRQVKQEDLEWAAKQANAHEFIASFPNGYATLVGEKGIQLSGGQKQRIAIARAILIDPKILLLDEATSALDSQSENLVQDALDKIMKNRTTIVIAHRLSTVRNAHQIMVLEKGKIIESGVHQTLLDKDGAYAHLVKKQLH